MCNFVSWKEDEAGNVFFLVDKDLKPRKLKEFKEYNTNWREDICGHGAITWFYPELEGKCQNKELEDFSNLKKFPREVVEAIKNMKMMKIGFNLGLLNKRGKKKYREIQQPAWKKYIEIEQPALKKYGEIQQPAWKKYIEIQQPA